MGASLAWDSSIVPFPVPRINKCSISHSLASRRRWEIHLNFVLCSRGALSSHFQPSEFFSWLEGCWSACMSYQRPAEWVEMFSEHEVCHTSLKSTMDISKQQNLLNRVFWVVNLSYSIWWAWTDIAKAMSHLSIVGRYIPLSHLQSHGEPICNVLLHGHLMCCRFVSVPLLVCLFFFFSFFLVSQATAYK